MFQLCHLIRDSPIDFFGKVDLNAESVEVTKIAMNIKLRNYFYAEYVEKVTHARKRKKKKRKVTLESN